MQEVNLEEVINSPRRFVLVDTSLLLLMIEGIPVLQQLEEMGYSCLVTPLVIKELTKLSKSNDKRGRASRFALRVVERKCNLIVTQGNYKLADDEIVEIVSRYGIPVATADKGLRRRVRGRVPTLYYRESQRRIEVDDNFV